MKSSPGCAGEVVLREPVELAGARAPKLRVVDLGGPPLAVFNLSGTFHVLSNVCPHQGGSLGEGKVEGSVVVCPLHQWKFDIQTGKGLSIPGPCARRYSAAVLGDDLYVGI